MERFQIHKIGISILNLQTTIEFIESSLSKHILGYICVTNSRTAYLANSDEEYCKIQNKSLLTVPDGMPLVWIAHSLGYLKVGRTCGPDLFLALLEKSEAKGFSHFFYGSTFRTIDRMVQKVHRLYPLIEIKGAVSPPFQDIEKYDIDALADEINKLRPTFFWCGLGAPKQERLMALLQPKLTHTICIGVGLVFEYFAETVKRAPKWMQNAGIEWSYRIIQQPVKISRVIKPFCWIILQCIKSKFQGRNLVE